MIATAHISSLKGRKGRARFALLTVTDDETDQVTQRFNLKKSFPADGKYSVSSKRAPISGIHNIVHMRISGQHNVPSGMSALGIIEDFRPSYLFLIGTAGGHSKREKTGLGDVVVADYLDYSGYVKLDKKITRIRKQPHDHPSSHLMDTYVERLRRDGREWQRKISVKRPQKGQSKVIIGETVSGNALLGDCEKEQQEEIINIFDKACAFEMEAFGLSMAVFKSRVSVHYNPQFLVIRGISDFVDRGSSGNHAERKKWTPYAVDAAASVAESLIEDIERHHKGGLS